MFKRYLIAACLQTTHEVIRLAENGITLETADQTPDLAEKGVFWTLYGRLEDGRSLAVSDCSTLQGALETYEHITGCKAPTLPADTLLVDLYAPLPQNLVAVGAELAFQIEQMKGMFNDEDGTIEKALDEFYETESAFNNANKVVLEAQQENGLRTLVCRTYEEQAALDAEADSETRVLLVTDWDKYPTFVTSVCLDWTGNDVPLVPILKDRFGLADDPKGFDRNDPRLLVPADRMLSCLAWMDGKLGVFTEVERNYTANKQPESEFSTRVSRETFDAMTRELRTRMVRLREQFTKSVVFVSTADVNMDGRAAVCAFTPLAGDVETLTFQSPYPEDWMLKEIEAALLSLSDEVEPSTVRPLAA